MNDLPNDPLAGDAKGRAGKLVAKIHGSVAPAVLRPEPGALGLK